MTNLETIQFLYSNYKSFLKLKDKREVLEDCLANVAQNLLKVDYEIEDPRKFIQVALYNELKVYYRKNKRYALVDIPTNITSDCIITQVNEEQEHASRLKNMHEAISSLPAGQKASIAYFLENGKFSAASGSMESMRTNYKLAITKLKRTLNPG